MNKSLERFGLLICGVICSGLALLFWHSTGKHGLTVLLAISLFSFLSGNIRLRKHLKLMQRKFDEISPVVLGATLGFFCQYVPILK